MLARAGRAAAGLFARAAPAACEAAYPTTLPAASALGQLRFATKKQGGSTQNKSGSLPKYLGVKMFGGQKARVGEIIVRQRGLKFGAGDYVGVGRDHTLFALVDGKVRFKYDRIRKKQFVNVDPAKPVKILW